jgi:arylsulfatase A-like enzyme
MLSRAGYFTAAVGKWHLGMGMPLKSGHTLVETWEGDPGIDFSAPLTDSPVDHGFDYYFGVSASLDMAPYVYIRNRRFVTVPDLHQPAVPFPHFVRKGPRSEDFVIDRVLDRLADEAVSIIRDSGRQDRPFFLYLALTAPHKPTQPAERFRGKTELGEYGDFIVQVDETIGRVLKALDDTEITDQTMVFYSSDNGSYMYRLDENEASDHVSDPSRQGYFPENHRANGSLRGTKADIWEAGHRVPFFVRWPGHIKAASRCPQTVSLVDIFATCAELVGISLDSGEAEDSYSILPMLRGEDFRRPVPVVHHSVNGTFAIRQGKWKLVLSNGSGGREKPVGRPFEKPYQLFDLSRDLGETRNLASRFPEIVEQLIASLDKIR